ncbi:MAG: DegV family protein [Lachnospiraceae bacterium]|nr:DegV family protein [Lachnospiraceae bacterium]
MSDFILSCCSTADLTREHFEKRNISYICFSYELDGVRYPDDLGQSMSFEDFYRAMEKGASTKTSQVNVAEFEAYFERFLQEGKDILHVCLSSGISGVHNSACVARDMLAERYPDRKIYVVDSLAAASGYGLMMDELADMRDAGKSVEEIYTWVEANKLKLNHWVATTELKYLVRGGRLSKTAGAVGGILNICPIIEVDVNGKLQARQKVRGKKKAVEELVKMMEQHAENGTDYSGKCYISQSACMEDALALKALVEKKFPKLAGKIEIDTIGTVIGSHTGPGTFVVFFWGSARTE